MKDKITLVMYSHSSYSDVWKPFFNQSSKYLSDYKKVLLSDKSSMELPEDWSLLTYDDSLSYSERVSSCLKNIDTPLCFFHHEDMFLYGEPDTHLLKEYENIVLNENVDFIRMLRSTDNPDFNYKKHSTLFHVPNYSQYFFAVQPSICKTDSLIKIFENTKINHLREFEIKVQKVCRNLQIKGLFHYDGESKEGDHHYGSNVYPYVATAVVKGKWNISEYQDKLKNILVENNININLRGAV